MNLFCKLGLHDNYNGSFITGLRSKFTHDHIGRHERHCLNCNRKQISISQFSKDFKQKVWEKLDLKDKPNYITYTDGDWLDIETKIRLAGETKINPEGVTYV